MQEGNAKEYIVRLYWQAR